MTPSAASQQLRILRHLRFVATRREGRSILYRLHDGARRRAAGRGAQPPRARHARLGRTGP